MLLVYIGLYTLFLVGIWGFFIIAKIHAFKFKNFSNHITKITNSLFVLLVLLSVFGYGVILFSSNLDNSVEIENPSDNFSEIDY
ncbi:hypothetical protein A9Q91_04140 [Candidatus Gracilibacteria bacterium 28_42_T64]|nr:hypothetical protein A9Q91_04140 [Candidatus Gracilibacteria bacterium 28_42_T64]